MCCIVSPIKVAVDSRINISAKWTVTRSLITCSVSTLSTSLEVTSRFFYVEGVSPRGELAHEPLVGSAHLKTTTSFKDHSSQKTCGICFEVVLEKVSGNRRFGILPNCNHCFCLTCICKWREAKQFENKIIRACPECRVVSDYVCPSPFWVDTPEEKLQTITNYKDTCSKRNCKHYKRGKGKCPFGNKCFYLHALPDGTKVDVGPPRRRRRSRNDSNSEMEMDLIRFIVSLGEDLLLDSDSDSSDFSDYYDYDSDYEYAFYDYLNDGEDDSNYFDNWYDRTGNDVIGKGHVAPAEVISDALIPLSLNEDCIFYNIFLCCSD